MSNNFLFDSCRGKRLILFIYDTKANQIFTLSSKSSYLVKACKWRVSESNMALSVGTLIQNKLLS